MFFKNYSLRINLALILIATAGILVFARLFGILSGIYRDIGIGKRLCWDSIKNTGIVFYGGLIGFLISCWIYLKINYKNIEFMNILAVCIPLFHSIARIGCFVGGCCFGVENYSYISVNYSTIIDNEVITIQRLPIQIIESIFDFFLFVYLLVQVCSKDWKNRHILRKYLIIYSVGRFLLEFFRGDLVRGVIGGISFSQLISILIWIYLLISYKIQKHEVNLGRD